MAINYKRKDIVKGSKVFHPIYGEGKLTTHIEEWGTILIEFNNPFYRKPLSVAEFLKEGGDYWDSKEHYLEDIESNKSRGNSYPNNFRIVESWLVSGGSAFYNKDPQMLLFTLQEEKEVFSFWRLKYVKRWKNVENEIYKEYIQPYWFGLGIREIVKVNEEDRFIYLKSRIINHYINY